MNAQGERGTYGCACVARDSTVCARLRAQAAGHEPFDIDLGDDNACVCLCHTWEDFDDEY